MVHEGVSQVMFGWGGGGVDHEGVIMGHVGVGGFMKG